MLSASPTTDVADVWLAGNWSGAFSEPGNVDGYQDRPFGQKGGAP
jgi:hypothetical protein